MTLEGGAGAAVRVQGNAATGGARAVDSDRPGSDTEHQGVMAIDETSQPQPIAPR